MSENEVKNLEDPGEGDWENAEVRMPEKAPRAVVSVAFDRGDFERIAAKARGLGEKTSEYIREAALARVRESGPRSSVGAFTSSAHAFVVSRGAVALPVGTRVGVSAEVHEAARTTV